MTGTFRWRLVAQTACPVYMFPCMPRKFWIALLIVFALPADSLLCAAPRPAEAGGTSAPVRYHLGDEPDSAAHWGSPVLDDSAWPEAQRGRWPVPPPDSDGFEWTRARVTVPVAVAGPLALRISGDHSLAIAEQVFVNGQAVAQRGSFPPQARPICSQDSVVIELPSGLVEAGTVALVAYRVWLPPGAYRPGRSRSSRFTIDESRNLQIAARGDQIGALLAMCPDFVLNSTIAVLGTCLLIFWRWAGGRELLLCGVLLVFFAIPSLYRDLVGLGIFLVPTRLDCLIYYPVQVAQMAITVEFIWAIHGLRVRGLKRLAQAALFVFNATGVYVGVLTVPTAGIRWVFIAMVVSVQVFNVVTFAANVWAFVCHRQRRLIAAALTLIPAASMLSYLGVIRARIVGPFQFELFNVGFFASSLALFITLGQRAWQGWRIGEDLRGEFDAAREVQQHLVAPAADVPGFKIESAYAPATQVGGDFFRVRPEAFGGLLVVVGDVSGKGLRAAMTVSAIVGALRTMPALTPARILCDLNRGLAGQLQGGFVTCCAALVTADGFVTIANAGHLAPYCQGAEIPVTAGLPLGIHPDADYQETQFTLPAGQSLTFLSDGVVEARNASGELFGFDRTLAISDSGADAIAQMAVAFGQDDDITVLTLRREAAAIPSPFPAHAVVLSSV